MAAATGFAPWAGGAPLIGVGAALVYPTLIAAVGDVAHPNCRATAVGVYRLWRDTGYVVGGLPGGVVADVFDLRAAGWTFAALSVASGLVVAARMTGRLLTPLHVTETDRGTREARRLTVEHVKRGD